MELSGEQRRILLETARQTIRFTLAGQSAPLDSPNDSGVGQLAGCFVSLHTLGDHRLRGCVGRLDAKEDLILALRQAAQSVLKDPRFAASPVRIDELPQLEIELTVICPMTPAEHCLDFDPLEDGIYLTIDQRSGCFLPQVGRETGWTRQQLLMRLCEEKLGVGGDRWLDESAKLMKFKTIIVGPEPFELQ
jgi:AmmeMemoRadiSam system protein A